MPPFLKMLESNAVLETTVVASPVIKDAAIQNLLNAPIYSYEDIIYSTDDVTMLRI